MFQRNISWVEMDNKSRSSLRSVATSRVDFKEPAVAQNVPTERNDDIPNLSNATDQMFLRNNEDKFRLVKQRSRYVNR